MGRATGKGLWYSQIGGLGAPAETFMLDGKQHMLFSGGGGILHVRAELRTYPVVLDVLQKTCRR